MSPTSWRNSSDDSVSGAVLRKLLENPIDVGYSAAAMARPYRVWQRVSVFALCVFFGAGGVWATHALRAPAEAAATARETLTTQVSNRISEIETRTQYNDELTAQIDEARAALGGTNVDLNPLADAGAASGVTAVTGPGISIELDDSDATSSEGRVKDFDFQVLINALWASGAEAIAIDGERIGPTTSVRTAGQAILVNLKPLNPPYTITAIGDPTKLQGAFARTRGSAHLAGLRDILGIGVNIEAHQHLEMDASPQTRLRYAQPEGDVPEKVAK